MSETPAEYGFVVEGTDTFMGAVFHYVEGDVESEPTIEQCAHVHRTRRTALNCGKKMLNEARRTAGLRV